MFCGSKDDHRSDASLAMATVSGVPTYWLSGLVHCSEWSKFCLLSLDKMLHLNRVAHHLLCRLMNATFRTWSLTFCNQTESVMPRNELPMTHSTTPKHSMFLRVFCANRLRFVLLCVFRGVSIFSWGPMCCTQEFFLQISWSALIDVIIIVNKASEWCVCETVWGFDYWITSYWVSFLTAHEHLLFHLMP